MDPTLKPTFLSLRLKSESREYFCKCGMKGTVDEVFNDLTSSPFCHKAMDSNRYSVEVLSQNLNEKLTVPSTKTVAHTQLPLILKDFLFHPLHITEN